MAPTVSAEWTYSQQEPTRSFGVSLLQSRLEGPSLDFAQSVEHSASLLFSAEQGPSLLEAEYSVFEAEHASLEASREYGASFAEASREWPEAGWSLRSRQPDDMVTPAPLRPRDLYSRGHSRPTTRDTRPTTREHIPGLIGDLKLLSRPGTVSSRPRTVGSRGGRRGSFDSAGAPSDLPWRTNALGAMGPSAHWWRQGVPNLRPAPPAEPPPLAPAARPQKRTLLRPLPNLHGRHLPAWADRLKEMARTGRA